MKITVSKMEAAQSQAEEAVRLFFERRDPVSVHTLAAAALQILHEHIDDEGSVWDANLFLHYNSIFIRDEHRGEWKQHINEAQNFFKHAKQDLAKGITAIEFDPATTGFYIFEAIRCLRIIRKEQFDFSPSLSVFVSWFRMKYPHFFKLAGREQLHDISHVHVDNLEAFRQVIEDSMAH